MADDDNFPLMTWCAQRTARRLTGGEALMATREDFTITALYERGGFMVTVLRDGLAVYSEPANDSWQAAMLMMKAWQAVNHHLAELHQLKPGLRRYVL